MRFEVKYPESAPHEVELQGTLAVLGRDPSCDLVLNDVKCSRRHAVLEAGPDGIAIRDTGSANGVYLNGKKIERANLQPGDVVGLGDVTMTVLAEDMPGTLVMGPEDGLLEVESTTMMPAGSLGIPTAPPSRGSAAPTLPPPPPVKAPAPRTPFPPPPPAAAPSLAASSATTARGLDAAGFAVITPAAPVRRPLTVSILAGLWAASVLLYGVGAIASLVTQSGVMAFLTAALFGLLALISGGMAFGLFGMKPWARVAQIVLAAIGILNCPFTLASIATLVYMFRTDAKARFADPEPRSPDSREGLFAALLLGTVVVGAIVALAVGAFLVYVGRQATVPPPGL